MPLGNPISLTQNVAQREIRELATEDQTLFTVDGGYMVNQLDVYRNGVLLNMNDDYTALDGSTVTLVNQCVANDEIVFRIYDNFRVADAIVSAASTQTISGNLVVTGELYPERINLTNINTSGVITATTFDGDLNGNATTATTADNLSGTPELTVSTITGVAATFTGAVSIGGTLTYEDVTNVDSVGVITAQSGIHVLANGVRVATGATVTGAENILIFETDGFERVRVGSAGSFAIGIPAINQNFAVGGAPGGGTGAFNVYTINSGGWASQIRNDTPTGNGLFLRGGGDSAGEFPLYVTNNDENNPILVVEANERVGIGTTNIFGALQVHAGTDANFSFSTASGEPSLEILDNTGSSNVALNVRASEYKIKIQGTEKVRIDSSGNVGINSTAPERRLDVLETASQTVAQFQTNGQTKAFARFECHGDNPVFVGAARSDFNIEMGGTDCMTINHSNQNVSLTGNVIFPNGKGINFGATQGGGATSDLLDDYEEGTWTPTQDAGNPAISNIGSMSGSYTKIGNQVTVLMIISQTSNNMGFTAGNYRFDGLPFTPTTSFTVSSTIANSTNTLTNILGQVLSNDQVFLTFPSITSQRFFSMTATYFTSD